MNYDEMTTLDNQSWTCIHIYAIDYWKCVPILFNLQRVEKAKIDKLAKSIVASLIKYGDLKEGNLA
jgi:hypothetical protein